ncbi:MAG: TROVE domain-containing protein [Pseudomonadota bacterium]
MGRNAAGGCAFTLDPWTRLERFLILGTEGGTYYASERALTLDALTSVDQAFAADGARAVAMIQEISVSGRPPRNDAAILALAKAAAAPELETRQAALAALPAVVRTGTHLFQFAEAVERFRGWGRSLRRAVAAWYEAKPLDALVLQAVKYPSRQVAGSGSRWSHRDLLRLAHPATREADRAALYAAIVARESGETSAARPLETGRPALAQWDAARRLAREAASGSLDVKRTAALVREHRLPREALPSEALNAPAVWEALLEDMPATAMIRSLAKMAAVGLLTPGSAASRRVAARLRDQKRLARARVHPLALLLARAIYAQGVGMRGSLHWTPDRMVAEALERAFYAAFKSAPATGKRLMLGLDVSGSMGWGQVAGAPVTPREGAAVMALATLAKDPKSVARAFTGELVPLELRAGMRLEDAVRATSGLRFGRTDCALPMLTALKEGLEVDGFVIYTDNETWAGEIHPMIALERYRRESGIAAKLVVVGMTATGFTIADPEDGGALDVVGFDTAAPALIADFLSK